MRFLILGGNGFIGSAVVGGLLARGHAVVAIGRDIAAVERRMPQADWRRADIARLTKASDWQPLFGPGFDAVVNCAGALQDGARDDVAALQDISMRALYPAAAEAGIRLIVQVSAKTSGAASGTPFLATKQSADQALAESGLSFVILRPALVVGRNAHGGSALLRALAAVPLVTPLAYGAAPVQVAALDAVVEAVAAALEGRIAPGTDMELASAEAATLQAAVARHRQWLGLAPARPVNVPAALTRLVSTGADLLGKLGWRSPLRTTAMLAAAGGVTSDCRAGSQATAGLDAILRDAPSGVQDLWFARLYLMKPLIIGGLAVFWVLSGAIALLRFDQSVAHLATAGIDDRAGVIVAAATALLDIALGIGVIVRRFAAASLKAMIAVSLAYLLGATVLAPALWLDPLGPLVKVLPAILLAAVALAILDER